MTSIITCTFTSANVVRVAQRIEKTVRFATAMALTNVARDARDEVIRELPDRFTIRTQWVKKGVRFKPADKKDANIVSRVVDMDAFMAIQETGGDKIKYSGVDFAIPIGARPTPESTTTPRNWPRQLLQRLGKGYFIAPITGRSVYARSRADENVVRRLWNKQVENADVGTMALWHRRGKKRYPIDLIYIFKDTVHVKPRFEFFNTVKKVKSMKMAQRLQEAFDYANKTSW